MLDSLSPPRRRLVLALIFVLALGAIVVAVLFAARSNGNRVKPVAQDTPGPVIVLPGYGGNTASLRPIVTALRSDRRQVVVFTATQGESGDLRVQAVRLRDLAARTLRTSGAKSVDVIGYSAGGVIARLWVRDYGGGDVARRVLTLGSPHHGTTQANLASETFSGACPAACLQLTEDSDLLRQLNAGDESPAGPKWITLRSTSDLVVTPTRSAILEGALNLLVQDACPDATTDHTALPSDPYVVAALGSALGTGPPTAPRNVSC